jgi:hypothetical protein
MESSIWSVAFMLDTRLASVLENRIPCIALAQLSGSILVLVGAEWYDGRTITLRHLLLALLVGLNVSTLLLLAVSRSKLADAREILVYQRQGPAQREAEKDFKAGRFRQYELQTLSPTPLAGSTLQSTFTGRTKGPFEVWSRPRFEQSEDEGFWLRLDSAHVGFYNGRMAFLYQQRHRLKQNGTNSP